MDLFSFTFLSPAILIDSFARITRKYYKNIIHLINDAVCYNQGAFAEYAYMASIKHRQMKKEYYSSTRSKGNLIKYFNALEQYVWAELDSIIKENYKYLNKYFEGRSEPNTRICIKCYDKDPNTGKIIIADYLRDVSLYNLPNTSMGSNTGFSYVYKTGEFFFSNNLPEDVKNKGYKNPRLLNDEAQRYKLSIWDKTKINLLKQHDYEWTKCWKRIEKPDGDTMPSPPETCYKSTLIVPMTLMGNRLSLEFKERFRMEDKHEKAIYGFLCFDNHKTNFFTKDTDVQIGYVFADILSLYLIATLTYTEYSITYSKVRNLINY